MELETDVKNKNNGLFYLVTNPVITNTHIKPKEQNPL